MPGCMAVRVAADLHWHSACTGGPKIMVSDYLRFELEALEPRLLLSADPIHAAVPPGAAAQSPAAIEERVSPDSNQTGIVSGAAGQVTDIFAGVVLEDLAEPAAVEK